MFSYYKKEGKDDNEVTFKNTGINICCLNFVLNLFPMNAFNQ